MNIIASERIFLDFDNVDTVATFRACNDVRVFIKICTRFTQRVYNRVTAKRYTSIAPGAHLVIPIDTGKLLYNYNLLFKLVT